MAKEFIEIQSNIHKTKVICVENNIAEEILQYILNPNTIAEYLKIQGIILEGLRNKQLYQKITNLKTIYEIRFTNKGRNDRIYCKQIAKGKTTYIVMFKFYKKKSQEIPKSVFKILKNKDNYEYNI